MKEQNNLQRIDTFTFTIDLIVPMHCKDKKMPIKSFTTLKYVVFAAELYL